MSPEATLESAVPVIPNSKLWIAKTGTPMLVIQGQEDTYALYYMCKSRTYRLFWPWPSHGHIQRNKNFKTPFEVRNYLNGQLEA